jgi:hypothetical protein
MCEQMLIQEVGAFHIWQRAYTVLLCMERMFVWTTLSKVNPRLPLVLKSRDLDVKSRTYDSRTYVIRALRMLTDGIRQC